jgi:hypothetical protein
MGLFIGGAFCLDKPKITCIPKHPFDTLDILIISNNKSLKSRSPQAPLFSVEPNPRRLCCSRFVSEERNRDSFKTLALVCALNHCASGTRFYLVC